MGVVIPKIDNKAFEDRLKEFRSLVPFYTPEWRIGEDENGAGLALAKIFLHMLGGIYRQVNRLPEKHLVAFLDRLGIGRFPAQPASVPVTFQLAEGAPGHVVIPGQTRVASGDVVFETEEAILAAPARLVHCFGVDTGLDTVVCCPGHVVSGEDPPFYESWLVHDAAKGSRKIFVAAVHELKEGDQLTIFAPGSTGSVEYVEVTAVDGEKIDLKGRLNFDHKTGAMVRRVDSFKPFTGENIQEHGFYLGKPEMSSGEDKAIITLHFDGPGSGSVKKLGNMELVEWEYYGRNGYGTVDWYPLYAAVAGSVEITLEKRLTGPFEELELEGMTGHWLRCRVLPRGIAGAADISMGTIYTSVKLLGNSMQDLDYVIPDFLFSDTTTDVYPFEVIPCKPFGDIPSAYNYFYIASSRMFSRKGSEVELNFTIELDSEDTVYAKMAWEYWNGSGWKPLGLKWGNDFTFLGNGNVGFGIPYDLKKNVVNGRENYWIRIGIRQWDYEKIETIDEGGNPIIISGGPVVPSVKSLTMSVTLNSEPLLFGLTYNNLDWKNRSEELNDGSKTVGPFYCGKFSGDALYFGFDQKIEKGPVSIYFAAREQSLAPADVPVLEWEYTAENGCWKRLQTVDGTQGLSRSGTVEMNVPLDFRRTIRLGQESYWLRARLVYQGTVRTFMPEIMGIYLNTARAVQVETVSDEIAGSGDGSAFQQATLSKKPVAWARIRIDEIKTIPYDERQQLKENGGIEIEEKIDSDGNVEEFWVTWQEVEELSDSGENDRHYELDRVTGTVTFGDGLHGKIVPVGTDNIKAGYASGGGEAGNLGVFEIGDLKTTLPYLDRVWNPIPSQGGTETESMASVIQRGPHVVRHRNRAVTADDFCQLALESSRDIARAVCLPGINQTASYEPGWVTVVVLPSSDEAQPPVSMQMRQRVEEFLRRRLTLPLNAAGRFQVWGPLYMEVSVKSRLIAADMNGLATVENSIRSAFAEYFHPLRGDRSGGGWDFGKVPCYSDVYALLETIPGVEYVEELSITLITPGGDDRFPAGEYMLTPGIADEFRIPVYGIVCNGTHEIDVRVME